MPPEALTSLKTAFTALSSVMPSSPTGPLSMKNPPSLMVSAVTPMSVAPPLPAAGAADGPVADGPAVPERAPLARPGMGPAAGPAAAPEAVAARPGAAEPGAGEPDAAAAGEPVGPA